MLGGILAKIATFTAGKSVYIWAGVGLLAFIGGMYVRIQYLEYDRDKLDVTVAAQMLDIELARQANTVNTVAIGELVSKLNKCRQENRILEQNSQQAVTDFQKTLKNIKKGVSDETQKVRQALQNETCAMVAVPSDVERVLRAGANSPSGDS